MTTPNPIREAEIERKYDVPDDVEFPKFDGLGAVSPTRVDVLVADYYDTPQFDLLRAQVTLRRRRGGDDAGWHLKTMGRGDVRHEVRFPLSLGLHLPAQLRAEVLEIVGEKALLPVVRIVTERATTDLFGDDGFVRASIVADTVDAEVLRRDVQLAESWREVEVELTEGEPESTFTEIEALLFGAGITPSESKSKVGRILASVEPLASPGLDAPAADVILAALAKHFGRIQALEGQVAVDAPDAVHQARIALRRMRSILQVYRKVFRGAWAKRVRAELKWAGERLGGPRDAEVALEKFSHALDTLESDRIAGPVREHILPNLERQHARTFAGLREAMGSPRWDAVFVLMTKFMLEAPVSNAGQKPAAETLGQLARRSVDRVETRLEVARSAPNDPDAWHDVRKAAKAARYAYEVLAEIDSDGADERRKRWKGVASAFGEVQDAVILDSQLRVFEAEARYAGEPTTTYELLHERLQQGRDQDLAKARELVEDATR